MDQFKIVDTATQVLCVLSVKSTLREIHMNPHSKGKETGSPEKIESVGGGEEGKVGGREGEKRR